MSGDRSISMGPTLARSRHLFGFLVPAFILLLASRAAHAQDLTPRAYLITPLESNVVNFIYGYYSGPLELNQAIPIKGATGNFSVPTVAYYRSFSFFGRSANVSAGLPYGVGSFEGEVLGNQRSAYRSGLFDSVFRVSVNLIGGPAMKLPQYVKWKQKALLGASLKVNAPTGQYSPRLLNWGTNRWSFKPELGYSQLFRKHWVVDAYAGVWFFTTNPALVSVHPPPKPQDVSPIGALEGHLSYGVKPKLWFSFDANYWSGGTATVAGVTIPKTAQKSSRLGVTAAIPLNKYQSIKFSYSAGAYTIYGGDYKNVSVSWQYGWVGKPWKRQ